MNRAPTHPLAWPHNSGPANSIVSQASFFFNRGWEFDALSFAVALDSQQKQKRRPKAAFSFHGRKNVRPNVGDADLNR
jgi:hypothetical protein